MTATVPKIPDPLVVLRRAEQRHTGEEPGDLTHLADAVRDLIIAPLTAGSAPAVDDVQVKQLLADKARLEGVITGFQKDAAARTKTASAQAGEIADLKRQLAVVDEDTRRRIDAAVSALETPLRAAHEEIEKLRAALTLRTKEVDEARAERDTARAQLRDRPDTGVDPSLLDQAQRDNARLADELACARRDLAMANRTLDELADDEAGRPAHVHLYELDTATGEHKPCQCGQPWIRDLIEDDEPVEPDVEPLDQLFARIRTELQETT